jgi:1,5-anhydro-D-fructose reductase (1,5-anhydro-D-mannitol-forming)
MSLSTGKLGWGIIGASDIAARFMIPAIRRQPDAEVVAVMSRTPQWSRAFAVTNSIPDHHTSVADLLANPAVDIVYVCSDNRLHREQTLAAFKAGKPVLCEKPLALSPDDATAMLIASKEAGVVFGTNHHLRTSVAVQTIRHLVAQGAVGRPLAARASHLANLPDHLRSWRINDPAAGGGPINDMGTHDFDALRFVLGHEIVEVSAMSSSQGMAVAGIEDGIMATLRFEDGLLAGFHAAYNIGFAGSSLDVYGSEGSLLGRNAMSATGGAELVVRGGSGERVIDLGPQPIACEGTVRAFLDAVHGRREPAATGFDGLQSVLVATAVRESARNGRAVAIHKATSSDARAREETTVE